MPKIKTNRGTRKRFRVTATGKLKHSKAGRRHLLSSKGPKRRRGLRIKAIVPATHEDSIRRLIPYL
ncbi:MAG: 50S ribosomal protein L35 [Deltaproteobacteria bacterium]|nr:50S ribosomal protein L35 [Deltaproteobacteria bacterium]